MTTVAVLQPGYLPWLGFFDQLARADIFVIYDDVQFDKHGWRNRNRIKTAQGIQWLTVPVKVAGRFGQRNSEVEIDNRQPWARKQLTAIRLAYSKSRYFADYFPAIEALLSQPWQRLIDLDLALIRYGMQCLQLATRLELASSLGIAGERSERLVNFCRHFAADRYLTGDAAMNYLDLGLFDAQSIAVEWQHYSHPVYSQLHGEFEPYLSILDLLFNCGPDSRAILTATAEKS